VNSPVAFIADAVRRERTRAGVSLSELARLAGIGKSTLSQLEAGTGNPSVETLWALSVALKVPFSALVEPPRPRVQVVRLGDGTATRSGAADYAVTLLSSCPPNARRDLYRIVAQPGADRTSDPHLAGTVEHLIVGSGRALVGPSHELVELNPGDYITYPGDAPHVFRALEPDTTATMVVENP
jgi:transcriptional regulator with XRE-family HTH domain